MIYIGTYNNVCWSPVLSQVYLIEVTRPKSKEQVFRRYSEFHEMHTKLVSQYPDHTLPALPGKIYVGRSQVRHVSCYYYTCTLTITIDMLYTLTADNTLANNNYT